jgi:hypothetical protein
MTIAPDARVQADRTWIEAVMRRIADDIGLIIDRPIEIQALSAERGVEKAALASGTSISVRLAARGAAGERHGCLLFPLAEAISLAGYLLAMPEEVVTSRRAESSLDGELKEGIREIGNLLGGAVDAAVRDRAKGVSVRVDGCQGVAAGAKPAFLHRIGDELLIGRVKAQIHKFPVADWIVMLPPPDLLTAG